MKIFLYTILFFSAICTTGAHATGMLFLDAPESSRVGEKIPVTVFLDTQGTPVNSVDITLGIPDDTVRLVGYQEYNGLVKFWISPPHQEGNKVSFIGGIPGGVAALTSGVSTSEKIPLVVLLFQASTPAKNTLTIDTSTILQHDGQGTTFPHERKGATIVAIEHYMGAQEGRRDVVESEPDTRGPVFEQISLISSSLLSKSPTLITFRAVDEDSGIAAYNAIVAGKKIQDIQSPFEVNKKIFSYTVLVEAYDLYGNKQTASVIVPGMILSDTTIWILLGLLIVALFIYKRVQRYAKK